MKIHLVSEAPITPGGAKTEPALHVLATLSSNKAFREGADNQALWTIPSLFPDRDSERYVRVYQVDDPHPEYLGEMVTHEATATIVVEAQFSIKAEDVIRHGGVKRAAEVLASQLPEGEWERVDFDIVTKEVRHAP